MSNSRSLERIATVLEVLAEHREERQGKQNMDARRATAAMFLNATGMAQAFKPVPEQFIHEGEIRCPCGTAHRVPGLGELVAESCSRHFIRTNGAVLAYREPESGRVAA